MEKKDPLTFFENKYLELNNQFKEIKLINEKKINKIFKNIKKEKYPNKSNLKKNIYA